LPFFTLIPRKIKEKRKLNIFHLFIYFAIPQTTMQIQIQKMSTVFSQLIASSIYFKLGMVHLVFV